MNENDISIRFRVLFSINKWSVHIKKETLLGNAFIDYSCDLTRRDTKSHLDFN